MDLDLKSLPNVYDPFPVYRWLRDHDPVHWSSSMNAWAVTRYADVLEIFDQPTRFSADRFRKIDEKYASRRPAVQAVGEILADWLVFRDPPDHTRLRSLLQKSFTPTQLGKSRARIQATVNALLDLVADRGEMDFIRAVAFPLPATVIAVLLGVPTEDIAARDRGHPHRHARAARGLGAHGGDGGVPQRSARVGRIAADPVADGVGARAALDFRQGPVFLPEALVW